MKHLLFLFISITVFNLSHSFAEEAWRLEKDKDGIKVWNRRTPNSALKEYRASVVLQTSMDKILAFLKNTSLYDKWMYKVDEGSVKVIKRNNENDYYTYMTISAPLIKSRETITHMVFNAPDAKGAILITLDGAPTLLPKNDKYVRIEKTKGFFKITPLGNGKVEFLHQAYGSPGGGIPDVLANLSSVDCPFYMLTKVKSLL